MELSEEEASGLLALLPPARGRVAGQAVACHFVRNITTDDIAQMLEPTTLGSSAPSVKRLRTQHHTLARLLATGCKNVEAAACTGYSLNRISILLSDPAFQDLMAYYDAQADQQFLDVHGKLAGLGEAVVEELQERLESDPDKLSTHELLRIGEFALDRSTAPPKSKTNTGPSALPQVKISFHGSSSPVTIEALPSEDSGDFL